MLASTGTGDIIPNATVTVRNPGTSTAISETIYVNDDPDTSQYTNGAFFTNATGLITFYLTDPKRIDVLFTKTGYTSVTIPVDVQKSSLIGNHALVDTAVHTASGLTIGHVLKATAATTYAFGVNPLEDKITTAGDILYGTAADTAARLGIGTAGQVLKVNSGATAPEWGAASAALGDLIDHKFVRKTADESVTSSVTLQDDDHLTFTVGTSQTWVFEVLLHITGALAGDWKGTFTVPAGATVLSGNAGPGLASTQIFDHETFSANSSGGTAETMRTGTQSTGDDLPTFIKGICITGATAGSVTLQWAQNTSDASATTVRTNSYLIARRVA